MKSRFQRETAKGNARKYRYTLPSLYMVYCREGIRGCYQGFGAKVLRMGIGGAVCMGAFEGICLTFVNFGVTGYGTSKGDQYDLDDDGSGVVTQL